MRKTAFIFMGVVLIAISTNAQPDYLEQLRRQELKKQQEVALQLAADTSVTAKVLKAKVDACESGAILAAAESMDTTLIPYLKLLAADEERRKRRNSVAFEAQVALAKLGDNEAFSQILDELESVKRGQIEGSAVIMKLGLIARKEGYRILYGLLDDQNRPPSEAKDMFYPTRSVATMSVLAITVKDPPTGKDRYSVEAWKTWFERNRHLID